MAAGPAPDSPERAGSGGRHSGPVAPPEGRLGPFNVRRLVLGDWSELVRDPIDLMRATLFVGALAMGIAGDEGVAVRLLATFGAVLLARALEAPRGIDLAFTLGMLLQGWGNALGLFDAWPWYNKVVHFVLPFGTGAMLYILLHRLGVVCGLDVPCHPRAALGIVLVTVALAFTAGGFYEVWEWFAHHELGAPIYVSYDDTITDMIDNTLGALGGGLVLMVWARRGWGSSRRPLAADAH